MIVIHTFIYCSFPRSSEERELRNVPCLHSQIRRAAPGHRSYLVLLGHLLLLPESIPERRLHPGWLPATCKIHVCARGSRTDSQGAVFDRLGIHHPRLLVHRLLRRLLGTRQDPVHGLRSHDSLHVRHGWRVLHALEPKYRQRRHIQPDRPDHFTTHEQKRLGCHVRSIDIEFILINSAGSYCAVCILSAGTPSVSSSPTSDRIPPPSSCRRSYSPPSGRVPAMASVLPWVRPVRSSEPLDSYTPAVQQGER